MAQSTLRAHLRRQLEDHLTKLGYSGVPVKRVNEPVPEIVRISPVRGRLAYGETVLRSDLQLRRCHERLLSFSQRRTRRRSSILFFIAVAEGDEADLNNLLQELDIRTGTRGGHVHVVAVAKPPAARRRTQEAVRA